MAQKVYWFDVTIRDPASPSYLAQHPRQLKVAESAEKSKTKKYREIAKAHHAQFVTISFEASGAATDGTRAFLKSLVAYVALNQHLQSLGDVRTELYQSIGVAIQRRNAAAVRKNLEYARAFAADSRRAASIWRSWPMCEW